MLERTFRTKRMGWVAGMAIIALAITSTAMATPDSPVVFGPKLTTDHPVRVVVGPSVRIDDEGRISLAWVEEDKDMRSVLYAATEQAGGRIGTPVRVNLSSESPYM